jgi:hypothetical protein
MATCAGVGDGHGCLGDECRRGMTNVVTTVILFTVVTTVCVPYGSFLVFGGSPHIVGSGGSILVALVFS